METVRCRTARLTLRNLRESDVDAIAAYRCTDAFQYIDDGATRDDVVRLVEAHRHGWSRADGETLRLAVELRDDGPVVGEVMLRYLSRRHQQAEFGAALDPRHQGRVIAVEALIGLFRYAFEEVGLHRLVGFTDVANERSIRLVTSMGLRFEGRLRHNTFRRGQWHDDHVVGVLADEWPALSHRYASLLGASHGIHR